MSTHDGYHECPHCQELWTKMKVDMSEDPPELPHCGARDEVVEVMVPVCDCGRVCRAGA